MTTTGRTRPIPLSFGYGAPDSNLPALAREAMEYGRRALELCEHDLAARWCDRACRLLPGDPTLKLLLATACLRADPARAKTLFRELAETHDGPAVRAGLAAAGLPLPTAALQLDRIEGRVESTEDEVLGWAWHPHNPDRDPALIVVPSNGRRYTIIATEPAEPVAGMLLGRPRAFRIPRNSVGKRVRILDLDGRDLPGSPVVFSATPPPRMREPRDSRRRMDVARFHAQQLGRESVLIITHAEGGGVERQIMASVAAHEAEGRRAVVLRAGHHNGVQVGDRASDDYPSLHFAPREFAALLRLLRTANPIRAEIHHLLGHDARISEVPERLGVPYSVHIHDHGWICPRIVLIDPAGRYCGEPDAPACDACIAKGGTAFDEVTSITAFRERSERILTAAGQVIAPSNDTAAHLRRYMPAQSVAVVPHERCDPESATPSRIPHHVCVIGAIGVHKGYRVLLDCAEDAAARDIPLRFTVVGTTIDDASLLRTGRVFVTGGFAPEEANRLIRAQRAALGWLPSIWPETWCFALSDAWRAGLNVAVFDIGAQAERVRATGRGMLLPLGLSPTQINDALLALSFA